MSEGIVTLVIKAANQSVPDHHMNCNAEWSVLHLKDHLSSEHPSKPRVDEQRLIYSGQLLLDNILLRNILRYPSENNSYTIHLVCSPPRNSTNSSPQHSSSSSSEQRRQNPQSAPATGSSVRPRQGVTEVNTNQSMTTQQEGTPVNAESTDGVRRRNVVTSGVANAPTPQSIDPSAYPSMMSSAFQASGDPMQQMATMQQMYANYMSYLQYMQMGGGMAGFAWPQQAVPLPTVPNPVTSTAGTTTAVPTPDQVEQPQEQNVAADAQQQQQQQPQQIRMNAQGGEVDDDDDDEGMGRDWLDWIYVLSRMVVLLSIVYFYSTFYKFMIVVCIAMLLYLYQAGWFRPARRVEQPREGENENDIQDDRNNNINNNNNNNEVPADLRNPGEEDNGANENQEENASENEAQSDRAGRPVEEVPVRPSILALSWTFVTSLFTSLIPEPPQVI